MLLAIGMMAIFVSACAGKGQDLVCAGVSSIAVGMMNALDRIKPSACDMQMEEAHINIQVILQVVWMKQEKQVEQVVWMKREKQR